MLDEILKGQNVYNYVKVSRKKYDKKNLTKREINTPAYGINDEIVFILCLL